MRASIGRFGLAMLAALVLVPWFACGGHEESGVISHSVSLSISSTSLELDQGASTQFTASVLGTSNQAVIWSIQESNSGGSIDSQGLFTAPFKAGLLHVVATSAQDSTKRAIAEVNVHTVTISINPAIGDMEPGESQAFTALVKGTVDPSVTWDIFEQQAGAITRSGIFTAPSQAGTYHVVATNTSDKTASASVPVRVCSVSVSITPRALGITPGSTRQFTASIAGTLDDTASWSVQEGAKGGLISDSGVYTAPAEAGVYHVLASSLSHPGVMASALVRVGPSSFRPTGDMVEARYYHTATLLQNGKVLVVGGDPPDEWASRATAELYDPLAGTFQLTGSMSTGRDEHTATLLPNGNVLITGGGIAYWLSYNTAEIYDPSTGQFTPTGQLSARRSNHTATLLKNGKVLIIGGVNWTDDITDPNLLRAVELYDPQSGTFSPAGSLAKPMWGHSATLLPDGRVLVIGGTYGYSGDTSTAVLIYDPQTESFTSVGSTNQPLESHTATLLPTNTVLIAGGKFYPPGSDFNGEIIDDGQLLDLATMQLSADIEMLIPRVHHTATYVPDKKVLITGGDSGSTEKSAELFDISTSQFECIGEMGVPRAGHTATMLLTGEILIIGGTSDKSAELYNAQSKPK